MPGIVPWVRSIRTKIPQRCRYSDSVIGCPAMLQACRRERYSPRRRNSCARRAPDSPVQFWREVLQSRLYLPLEGEDREAKLSDHRLELIAIFLRLQQASAKISNAVFNAARRWHGDANLPRVDGVMNTTTGDGSNPKMLRQFALGKED